MKVEKNVLPAEYRYALYVRSDLGKQVKEFHKNTSQDKPLWVSAEAVVQAGLKALGMAAA